MDNFSFHLHKVNIPFRLKYGHAKAQHASVSSVIGILSDGQGFSGYGEAVPRTYVTGENCDSVLADCVSIGNKLRPLASLSEARDLLLTLACTWQGPFPSCAFNLWDLAIHDLIARRESQPLYKSLGARESKPLHYTASIGFGSKKSLTAKLLLYKLLGFSKFKIKVGQDDDLERIAFIKRILGSKASFYADANGAWTLKEAPGKIAALAEAGIWAIEEPLSFLTPESSSETQASAIMFDRESSLNDEHFDRYRQLKGRSDLPLIADESLISYQSFLKIRASDCFDILNIRLSKCGGVGLASKMIEEASPRLKYGICAMVGETSVLANHGSHFAEIHSDYTMLQGHSHSALQKQALCSDEPRIRYGGKLNLDPEKPGIGLKIKPNILEQWTIQKELIAL